MLSISSRGHVENSWIQHHLKRVFCWQFAHPFTREKHTSIPSVWQYLLLHLSSWLLLPIPWYSCPPSISRILWRIHSVSISCWPTTYRLISSWKMTGRCHTKKSIPMSYTWKNHTHQHHSSQLWGSVLCPCTSSPPPCNFQDLCTINGILFTGISFHEAINKCDLFTDEHKGQFTIQDAVNNQQSPKQLHFLFFLIVLKGCPAMPLWIEYHH